MGYLNCRTGMGTRVTEPGAEAGLLAIGSVLLPLMPHCLPIMALYGPHSVFQTKKLRLRWVKSLVQGKTVIYTVGGW